MSAKPSGFIWYELHTTDSTAAAAFYAAVIGWTAADSGVPGMSYQLLSMGDTNVGGLLELSDDATTSGALPTWLGYLNVESVDDAVASAVAAGASIHMPAMDVPTVGRMALIADPEGTQIYLMTPTGEGESPVFSMDAVGHCTWNELHAHDGKAMETFYSGQFSWEVSHEMDMGPGGTYVMLTTGNGQGTAGMFTDTGTVTPCWMYYFRVTDLDAAIAKVSDNGGKVTKEPSQVPGGDFMVHARDPQGAAFGLVGPRAE